MSTVIRSELSKKNKYFISKHRYYELKHFCLQYPEWIDEYRELSQMGLEHYIQDGMPKGTDPVDSTADLAMRLARLRDKIEAVTDVAKNADPELSNYILKAVTEGYSFVYLKTVMDIPCEKDMYYDRYRKFFYLLSRRLPRI